MQDARAIALRRGPRHDVEHRTLSVDGVEIFYREAGAEGAPALLLPHGYPCSSFEFRNFLPALADRFRLIAPDLPGFGYSATPDDFRYDFDGYGAFLARFAEAKGLTRYALYLHDYGTWMSLRLAMRAPERVAGLIIQNGDIYEDALGPKYAGLRAYFEKPTPEGRAKLEAAVSEEGFREEFLNGSEHLAACIPPDLWKLHWPLMNTPARRRASVALMEAIKPNLAWWPRFQAYLRERKPPTLIVWGPHDGYMPEPSARAYLRDLPEAELHLLDGGHWLLETHLDDVVRLTRDFLGRVHARAA